MTEQLIILFSRRANYRGRVIASEHSLLEELDVTRNELAAGVRKLEEAGLVEILSPLPFLALNLRSWSGSSRDRVPNEQQISSATHNVHREVPVSSTAAAAIQQREVGGAGEGEKLLDEVLAVLGPEADREDFRRILAGHQPALIRRCLTRVQATKNIRISRAALFRSLLQKLSR